MYIKP